MTDEIRQAVFASKEMRAFTKVEQECTDAEHVKSQYENHWGKRIGGIEKMLDKGESLPIF